MKSYYIYNGTESTGPFNMTELKSKALLKSTQVWCEGMTDWKQAGDIPELQSLFIAIPPPFKIIPIAEVNDLEIEEEEVDSKILGVNKTLFYMLTALIVMTIGTLVFTMLKNERTAEIDQKNSITEKDNLQFQLQEKQIEEQKRQMIEREKVELERILKEKKIRLNTEVVVLQEKLFLNISALDQAKDRLKKAQEFQLLRSASDKDQELGLIESEIESINKVIVQTKKEMDHIYLELEKIKI